MDFGMDMNAQRRYAILRMTTTTKQLVAKQEGIIQMEYNTLSRDAKLDGKQQWSDLTSEEEVFYLLDDAQKARTKIYYLKQEKKLLEDVVTQLQNISEKMGSSPSPSSSPPPTPKPKREVEVEEEEEEEGNKKKKSK